MEPARTLEFNRRRFVVHATESRGGAAYAIRRSEKGRALEFLATKIEDRGGRAVETPLAHIEGEWTPENNNEFYVEQIKNSAGTPEGARLLTKLYDHMEAHLKQKGARIFSTDAFIPVYNFFRLKGFSTDDRFAKEKAESFRKMFARLQKRGVRQEAAKRRALVGARMPVTIPMKKEIARTPP